jgi:hypothetical protein
VQLLEYVGQLKAIHRPESHWQQGISNYERARSEEINPVRGSLPEEGPHRHILDICISACPRKICTAMSILYAAQDRHILYARSCQK